MKRTLQWIVVIILVAALGMLAQSGVRSLIQERQVYQSKQTYQPPPQQFTEPAAFDPGQPLRSEELAYGPLRLGMTLAEVESYVERLVPVEADAPRQCFVDLAGERVLLNYEPRGDRQIVTSIAVYTRAETAAPRGIRVGDSIADLLRNLPWEHDDFDGRDGFLYGAPVPQAGEQLALACRLFSVRNRTWVMVYTEDAAMIEYQFLDDLLEAFYISYL